MCISYQLVVHQIYSTVIKCFRRSSYSGDVATSTADITTFKILINSTLSTEDAAMMMMDIKNYYLGTPMPRFEYMKMLLSRFPEEIVQKYNLNALAVHGWVYIEI
jgi:hypothetical protein